MVIVSFTIGYVLDVVLALLSERPDMEPSPTLFDRSSSGSVVAVASASSLIVFVALCLARDQAL